MITATYDRQSDVTYVSLASGPVSRTLPFAEDAFVDVDGEGQVIGIELLPSQRTGIGDLVARFRLEREAPAILAAIAVAHGA